MKKILSILICLFFGVTSVWAESATASVSATLTVRTQPDGSGYVKTEKSQLNDFSGYTSWSTTASSETATDSKTATTKLSWGVGTATATATANVYGYTRRNEGYDFVGWSSDGVSADKGMGTNQGSNVYLYQYIQSHTYSRTWVAWINLDPKEDLGEYSEEIYALFKPIISIGDPEKYVGSEECKIVVNPAQNTQETRTIYLYNATGWDVDKSETSNVTFGLSKDNPSTSGSDQVVLTINVAPTAVDGETASITFTSTNNNALATINVIVEAPPTITFVPSETPGTVFKAVQENTSDVTYTLENGKGNISVVVEKQEDKRFYLNAITIPDTHRFYRWKITNGENVRYLYNQTDQLYEAVNNDCVTAEFVTTDYAIFMVIDDNGSEILFNHLQAACGEAAKKSNKIVYIKQSGKVKAENYTIPSGVTLLIPGDDANTCLTQANNGAGSETYLSFDLSSVPPHNCIKYITLDEGTHITVNGVVCVYAKLGGVMGYNGVPFSHGEIKMGNNSEIRLKAGSKLFAYGYIVNADDADAQVVAESGATVYESVQLRDWRGGTATTAIVGLNGQGDGTKVFPFGQYYIQNIESRLVVNHGASMRMSTAVEMTGAGLLPMNVSVIIPYAEGVSGMFCMKEGAQLIKWYDSDTDHLHFEFKGENVLDQIVMPLKISILDVVISSSNYVLPFNSNMSFHMTGANLEVKNDVLLFPGSTIEIDNSSTLTLNKNLYIYDLDQFLFADKSFFFTAPVGVNVLPLPWIASGAPATRVAPTSDATLIVDGQVIVNGALYTTSSGANITSNGGGIVKYNSIGSAQYTNQKWQSTDVNHGSYKNPETVSIPITNKLHNDKSKYTGDEYVTVSGTGTYTYNAEQGRWASDAEAGISGTQVPTFEMTTHATSTNTLDKEIVVTFYKPDAVTFQTSDFDVVKTSGDNFALGTYELRSDGKLYIPVSYTQQNKHGEYEAVFTLTDKHEKLDLNTPIRVTASENYTPEFTVPEEFSIASTIDKPTPKNIDIQPANNNVAGQDILRSSGLVWWDYEIIYPEETPEEEKKFSFAYGNGETYLSGAQLSFTPASVGTKTATLRIIAAYDEDNDPETDNITNFKDIALVGEASLNPNDLAFDDTWNTMFVGDTRTLFANMGNHANAPTQIDPLDDPRFTISGNGIDQPYTIRANQPGDITITASQVETSAYEKAELSKPIHILPTEQWNWANLYYGSTHTHPITTNAATWTLALADDNTEEVKNLISLKLEDGEYYITIGEPANVSNSLTAKFIFTSGQHTSTYTATLSGMRHLTACLESQARYDAMTYGVGHQYETNFIKNVDFIDGTNSLSFASHTAETSIWTMQFIGTPDKISFTPSGTRKWHLEESVDAITWSNVENVAARDFVSGEPVSLSLKPTTRFVRITYNAGEESVGTLTDLCVTKLAISVSTSKLYLPIKGDEGKTIKLTHTKNANPSIQVSPSEGLEYSMTTPIYADGVYETLLTLTATTPQTYILTAREDGVDANVEVVAYTFPQGLPIKSNEWIDAKKEFYHFYTVESSFVAWDATNNRIVFQNPGNDNVPRTLTMAFEGAPSIVSFSFSADINSTQWTIEESVDGSTWKTAGGNSKITGNTMRQELHYTTRYVRLTYNGGNIWTERYMTGLVIEGYPKVILTPSELELNETDKSKTFTITAINLQNIVLQVDNDNFTLQHGSSASAKSLTITAESNLYPDALGINKMGDIDILVNWVGTSIVNAGEVTIINPDDDNAVLGTVQLLGAKSAITYDDATKTGIWTGVPDGAADGRPTSAKYTLDGSQDDSNRFAEYAYQPVNVSSAFLQDASKAAIFDYLFIYGETTTTDGTTLITLPTTEDGSNAQTPYYIYKKNADGTAYDFVEAVENANYRSKTQLNFTDAATTTDADGFTYYSIKPAEGRTELSIYVTGFCPYATTGFTKYDEGVWYIQGEAGEKVDLYLENCHIYSRNKTESGAAFNGRQGSAFTEGYVRGSGGVFVFECVTKSENIELAKPFEVSIHMRGDNVLKSNYGSFFELMEGMRAFQVSSPIQVHLASDTYVNTSKVTLNFDDIWPTAATGVDMLDYERTNGFLSLQKQVNNAPSIDLGNQHTTVNFKGGRVELQNAAIVSTNYKTTLAISHRSGEMGALGLDIRLAYGIGTDAVGGTVNFYDGTTTVIPMTVPTAYRAYYLMDTQTEVDGDGKEVITELSTTSCLRCPDATFVYGGSHCMLRACNSVTSKGGAPSDGTNPLGKYEYTLVETGETPDVLNANGLATIKNFPNTGLQEYYAKTNGYLDKTYGLNSVAPDANKKLYLWLPENYGYDVNPEEDVLLTTWKACMTEIAASYAGKTAGIGGDLVFDADEEVKYLLYCKIDEHINKVITAEEKYVDEDGVERYRPTYQAPVKDPTGQLADTYLTIRPTMVGKELQNSVTNLDDYKVSDRIYYITTASADTWMNFTAPFDVANIYVVETYDEREIEAYFDIVYGNESTRSEAYSLTGQFQAKHNTDFAAFFAMSMALGSDKSFVEIYKEYEDWAKVEDAKNKEDVAGNERQLYTGGDYTLRGMYPLTHYHGSNFMDANFYLYKNLGIWGITGDDLYQTQWAVVPEKSGEVLLEKGATYSMLFPHSLGKQMVENRTYWDYWTGKFLIFESTLGSPMNPHEVAGQTSGLAEIEIPENPIEAVLAGNKTFAQFATENTNVYLYKSTRGDAYFEKNAEGSYVGEDGIEYTGYPIINPTTSFLMADVPANPVNNMPARGITRDGKILYDESDDTNGNQNGTTGNHIPTVGGGNDLFITSIAGGINVAVATPQNVRVLSSTGAVIYSGYVSTAVDIQLPTTGIYIVSGENEVQKILY